MFFSSTIGGDYLNLLDSSFESYVWDWSHTWSSAATSPKLLGSIRSDRGRFVPIKIVSALLTSTNTATANIANVGIYTSTPSAAVDSTISSTSVGINSTTVRPISYVISALVTTTGTASVAAGAQVGIDITTSSGATSITGRTWFFGFHVR